MDLRTFALAAASLCGWTLAACGSDGGASDAAATTDASAASDSATSSDATADATTDPSDADTALPAPAWDPDPTLPPCAVDGATPLLDQALAHAGVARDALGFSSDDYAQSAYATSGKLDDVFLLPWFRATQADALHAACFGAEVAASLDAMAAGRHPVAAMIRHAAKRLERWQDGPPLAAPPSSRTLTDAVAAACDAAGKTCAAADLEPALATLPADLRAALVPVFDAMADALAAHRAMVQSTQYASAQAWVDKGQIGIGFGGQYAFLLRAAPREYLSGLTTRPALDLAAARLAYAIESVDWAPFRGRSGVTLELETALGVIRIRDAAADTYPAAAPGDAPLWFFLDLGGDDVHEDDIGANTTGALGVNVAIDLDGKDSYGYAPHPADGDPDWLLPADDGGRYAATTENGPISASPHARQGAARNGIAMLFDLGQDDDHYRSLTMSQGYAHLGVGVLLDDGGDDVYESESASQGAAVFGIGLFVDLGAGKDQHRIFVNGQGSGNVAGAGIAFDGGGDDLWWSDPGLVDHGGHPLVFSPQMPGQANTSLTQGAGSGIRWDSEDAHFSGGLGILRDAGGDDHYTASLFAQGSGYWQGTGILSDGGGSDSYDALYYVQGGGAHYSIAMLLDGGPGDDQMNQVLPPAYMQMGAGHDFTLGLLVNEQGDDRYHFAGLAVGASNCNGIGIFVDNGGDDTYDTTSDYGSGMGNISDECAAARPDARSIGIMLDAGGSDTYTYPESTFAVPHDDTTWGHITHALPSEHGAGVDGTGETGIHAR
ncbi:MAG: hypothetical protein U1F43_20025 [Myxococcota bacterium]